LRVPAIDTDDLILTTGASVLVLDIEGYENTLLRGLHTLNRLNAIVVEWHFADLGPDKLIDLTRALRDVGFTAHVDMELPATPTVTFKR
jgi:hypothetical protein